MFNLFRTKEGFEPTYLDSEQYYKQVQPQSGQDQVNRFNPTETSSKGYQTGYNNQFSTNLNAFTQPGYPLSDQN